MATDIAALGIAIEVDDTVKAKKALDDFAASADRAGKAADGVTSKSTRKASAESASASATRSASQAAWEAEKALQREAMASQHAANRLWASQKAADAVSTSHRRASVALKEVAAAQEQVARASAPANDNLGRFAGGTRAASFAARNLNYQLMDMAQGFALGMPPMMIMMQQVPQAADAFGMLAKESGGAGRAIAGLATKFAPAIVAVGAASTFFAALTTEINKNSQTTVTWMDVVLGTYDAVRAFLVDKLGPAYEWLAGVIGKVWDWSIQATKAYANTVISIGVGAVNALVAAWQDYPAAIGEIFINAANLAIQAVEGLANRSIGIINSAMNAFNNAFGTSLSNINLLDIPEIENRYTGAFSRMGTRTAQAFISANQDYVGRFVDYVSPFAQGRAVERMKKDAEKAGKSAGEAAGKAAAKAYSMSFAEAFKGVAEYGERIKQASSETRAQGERIAGLERELKVAHLVGRERDNMLRQLEYEAERAALVEKQKKALQAQELQLAEEYGRQVENLDKIKLLQDNIKGAEASQIAMEKATRAANDQLRDMVDLLDRIGGFGSVLGSILAVAGGDYRGIARGPLGDLLSHVLTTPTGAVDAKGNAVLIGDRIAKEMDGVFTKVFGPGGIFGQTLQQSLVNAGLGMMASNAILGNRGIGGQIGSGIGGALGGAVGSKVFGMLGSFAGPVGSIVGGLLGGLVGGLFGGAKKGIVSIGGSGSSLTVGGTKHSNSQLLGAATQAAEGLIGTINNIADALGGTINAANARLTIGMRNDKWVLDPTGQARTKGSGVQSFASQEEAVKAAVKMLIDRGVIGGIRDSTMNILRAGRDLEAQLQKALAFEQVFKEMETASSPFVGQLREMQAGFQQLTAIFQEAGASAEEYGQLQKFMARQQKMLVDQAMSSYRSTFYSDAENTSYARSVIKATLEPFGLGNTTTVAQYKKLVEATDALKDPELFGALMELTDEFALLQQAAENAKQAAEQQRLAQEALALQRGQMEVELLRLQGKEIEALARSRQLELAAIDGSLRGLQEQIHKWQDISEAQGQLRQAWERESATLTQTIDDLKRAGDQLREFRNSLNRESLSGVSLAALAAEFRDIGRMAMMGDITAMGRLPDAGRSYLDAAMAGASSAVEYQRILAEVRRTTDSAIGAADQGVTVAEEQLAAMREQVSSLINIDETLISVEDAMQKLLVTMAARTPTEVAEEQRLREAEEREREREARRQAMEEDRQRRMEERLDRLRERQEDMNRLWSQIAAGVLSITVRTDPLEPLEVEPAP